MTLSENKLEDGEIPTKALIGGSWDLCEKDVIKEVEIRHIHQDLIDSYQEGQAWQSNRGFGFKNLRNSRSKGEWVTPIWSIYNTYRLHPYNDLIQAHRNGAKIQTYVCGEWVDDSYPHWHEDTQYRLKPNKT
jgi:hypothetical protein